MTRSLTVLCESDQTLVDEHGIVSVDVQTEQHESTSTDSTYGVQETQALCDEVVGGLAVALVTEVVLRKHRGRVVEWRYSYG